MPLYVLIGMVGYRLSLGLRVLVQLWRLGGVRKGVQGWGLCGRTGAGSGLAAVVVLVSFLASPTEVAS